MEKVFHVFVADDDPLVIADLRQRLAGTGYRVLPSAPEADCAREPGPGPLGAAIVQQRLFEQLRTSAPVGFAAFGDVDGRVHVVSRRFEAIFGLEPGTVQSQAQFLAAVFADPHHRAAAAQHFDSAQGLAGSAQWTVERLPFVLAGGEKRIARLGFDHLRDLGLVLVTAEDVTQSARADAAARMSETRLAAAVSASTDAVWEWDVPRSHLYFSARWFEMLGRGSQLFPMTLAEWQAIVHPDDRRAAIEAIQANLREPGPPRHQPEFRVQRADGTWMWVLSRGGTVDRDEHGRPLRVCGTATDITERKQLLLDLQNYRDNLEALVASRTRELAEAQKRAEAASMAKSAFLANMSHEIRTPMNAIIGLTHLLHQSSPTPGQRTRLRKIERAAQHLLAIINDILDLSKVEAGKMRLDECDFDIVELLSEVHEALVTPAEDKGLQFQFSVASDLPHRLRGDSLRLRQILLNLGSNAVKFCDKGGVRIHAAASADAAGTRQLRIEVTDSGIGIAPEQLRRLFEPFEQADKSITRHYGGTGLGLAICRRLAALLSGEIGVSSAQGIGSTFWVEIPLVEAEHDALSPRGVSSTSALRSLRTGVHPSDITILLVEDDLMNQEVAVDLLTASGFRVDVANNGAIAVEMAAKHPYDLVLMDVQMPVMDGLTATRELRARPYGKATPIVAMTANALVEDQAACREAGMDEFIAKPIDPMRLMAVVANWTGAVPARPQRNSAVLAAAPALPVASEVLDLAAGLRVVQGDPTRYYELVHRFRAERGNSGHMLRQALTEGRLADAVRLAHTIKGSAGLVGAAAVQRAAAEVEAALRLCAVTPDGGRNAQDGRFRGAFSAIEQFDEHLQVLLRAVAETVPLAEVQSVREPLDRDAATRELSELAALLGEDDAAAVDLVRNKGELYRQVLGDSAQALVDAVCRFDFASARQVLSAGRT
ncbi:MAG: response regulator [Deltaproteobacteria bacterium]|nr:response regulator [Deltaproteobacteria bacterium]